MFSFASHLSQTYCHLLKIHIIDLVNRVIFIIHLKLIYMKSFVLKRNVLMLLAAMLFHPMLHSNPPPPVDVTLSTQAEVNAFNQAVVTGSLTISGADIVDLSTMSILTTVGGRFSVKVCTTLVNLDGLSHGLMP